MRAQLLVVRYSNLTKSLVRFPQSERRVLALLTRVHETLSNGVLDAFDAPEETDDRSNSALMSISNLGSSMPHGRYNTFADFYPFYLSEHRTAACRRLHFVGTALVICLLVSAIVLGKWWLLALVPVAGYGFAWVGHFAFEHNKPATFEHPWYSLCADFVMFRDILLRRIAL